MVRNCVCAEIIYSFEEENKLIFQLHCAFLTFPRDSVTHVRVKCKLITFLGRHRNFHACNFVLRIECVFDLAYNLQHQIRHLIIHALMHHRWGWGRERCRKRVARGNIKDDLTLIRNIRRCLTRGTEKSFSPNICDSNGVFRFQLIFFITFWNLCIEFEIKIIFVMIRV